MKNYLDLLRNIKENGKYHPNRTGVGTLRLIGATLEFDMADGFPAMTTKKLAFRSVVGELLGFIRGYTSAQDFRSLGCHIWDANANENAEWLNNRNRLGTDDLGRIYGAQWRKWTGPGYTIHDQLADCVTQIAKGSNSRRLIVDAWNPSEMDMMALPPCHVLHQYHVDNEDRTLSMTMYQRSCDTFLGIPFNIASYALLLQLVSFATGYRPGKLVMFLADVHIYENHIDQVMTQLEREPHPLPSLEILGPQPQKWDAVRWLEEVHPDMIQLENYVCEPAIKAPMAV